LVYTDYDRFQGKVKRLFQEVAMRFSQPEAEIYVPDGLAAAQALARTTHLCIAAHQDDIEIMAAEPILACYQNPQAWFTGVVVTDGRGSPRNGLYKNYSDEEMRLVRFKEQRKAALVGEYAAQVMLDFPSRAIKSPLESESTQDLAALLRATQPAVVYTHNLTDKHDTHVAVALRVIAALRSLAPQERPQRLIGCEVWRGLDWMVDSDKITMNLAGHENLQTALLGVFDSQIAGGKRYDLASLGRRRANATFFESHGVDDSPALAFGVEMTELMHSSTLQPKTFALNLIRRFERDVADRLARLEAA